MHDGTSADVSTGVASEVNVPRSDPSSRRSVGPFEANREVFVVESNDSDLLERIDDGLVDLRHRHVATSTDDDTATVFLVERNGPVWLSHPWSVFRDGELCEASLTDDYVVPYVLWEVTRLVLDASNESVVPIHAAALERDGKAMLLCGPSLAGKSTLAAFLTLNGWGFLTDEVGLIDVGDPDAPVVRSFHRPIGVRRGGPLDHLVDLEGDQVDVLVPASRLGKLGHAAPLVGIVCPRYVPDGDGELRPLSPAEALTTVVSELPSLGRDGAADFHVMADVVTRLPSYAVDVDDLATTAAGLARLVGDLPIPGPARPVVEEPERS